MAICNKPGHGDNESFMSELEQRCIQAETALAEEQHLLQTLIDAMPDRIFVKDTNSRFTRNNRVHRKVLGALCQTEITGKTDYDFKPPESAARSHADDQPPNALTPHRFQRPRVRSTRSSSPRRCRRLADSATWRSPPPHRPVDGR